MMDIYVGNLSYQLSEEKLRQAFEAFGLVKSVKVITDRETGRPKGFGFVEMPDEEEALAAMEALNGSSLEGRKIIVNESRQREGRGQGGREDKRNSSRYQNTNSRHNNSQQRDENLNESSIPELLVPEATKTALGSTDIDNFHLKLNTFAKYGKPDPKKDDKKFLIEKVDIKSKIPTQSVAQSYLSSAKELHKNIRFFNSTTDSRLIVGIGSESVYEVGITLHHIYGIPYIPGQAIKGITRSWYISEKFENDEAKALKSKLFTTLFGGEDNQGNIIFHDAFPIKDVKMELDIMNPHYGDYYQGKTLPADYLSPSPIKFLTVAPNTEFQFILSSKNKVKDRYFLVAESIIKRAITDHGIGAKTAVGYGYFSMDK